jgi:glycosyltransferase 2 family protein
LARRWRLLLFAGKAAITVLLVGWLISSGSLDVGALGVLVREPVLLVATVALFAVGAGLSALRWRLLLALSGISIAASRALQLQLTAMFFNVVGAIGGDIVKSIYVARDVAPAQRPTVFLIAFVDRVIALVGLVVVAVGATMLRGRVMWEQPELRGLFITVLAIAAVMVIGTLVVFVLLRGTKDGDDLSGRSRLRRLLADLVIAARQLSKRPAGVFAALGLSMMVYIAGIAVFALMADRVILHDVTWLPIATVYPLGMLTLALPISLSGIGVGHVAFDRLFAIVGLDHGATVFNIYVVGQIALSATGALAYLGLRREAPPPSESEAAVQSQASEATSSNV